MVKSRVCWFFDKYSEFRKRFFEDHSEEWLNYIGSPIDNISDHTCLHILHDGFGLGNRILCQPFAYNYAMTYKCKMNVPEVSRF